MDLDRGGGGGEADSVYINYCPHFTIKVMVVEQQN